MPAPVYLNVWFPGIENPAHVADSFPLLIRSFPHPQDISLKVTSCPAGLILDECKLPGCEFAVWWVSGLNGKRFELHIHATPKDTKNWIEAHCVHVIGKICKYDAIRIIYPPAAPQGSPTQVASNFPAYGYIDPTTSVPSACLKKDGTGSSIMGASINPPPGYDWAFGFQNIAPGTYAVIVTGQTDQQTTWVKI